VKLLFAERNALYKVKSKAGSHNQKILLNSNYLGIHEDCSVFAGTYRQHIIVAD
jgi:hypothetical protein